MTDDLAARVTRKIADAAIRPHSRLRFLASKTALWTITVVSVLIGAVAVATLIFYFADKNRTGGRGFDEMPLDDFFEIVPYFWAVSLVFAACSATLAFRATPRGFLRRPTSIFAFCLAASTAAGLILYISGVGPLLNRKLADAIPSYARVIAVEDWRNTSPEQGRLVGQSLGLTDSGQLVLRDFTGTQWLVTVADSQQSLDNPLGSVDDLDIIGTMTGPNKFSAINVTDWR